MITSQCGKLPCVQRTGSLPQRHYFSILRPRCKGAGRISGKVLAMLGRFCPRFPPSPRRFVKIVGNRPARRVLGRAAWEHSPPFPVMPSVRPALRPGGGSDTQAAAPARPVGGPMKSSPLRRGQRRSTTVIRPPCLPPGSSVRLPYIVGRAFTPAGGLAAARKGIGKVVCRTPQSADADSSPYRGAFRVAVPPKPPLQGAAESSAACGGESETEQV